MEGESKHLTWKSTAMESWRNHDLVQVCQVDPLAQCEKAVVPTVFLFLESMTNSGIDAQGTI